MAGFASAAVPILGGLRWAGPAGWQPRQPPADPNFRMGARRIEPPPGTQQNYRSPVPQYPLTSVPLPPQVQSAPLTRICQVTTQRSPC
jgi:hypothetical protein